MKPRLLIAFLTLVACTEGPPRDNTVAEQERLCTAAVASHIGQPTTAVNAIRIGQTPSGDAVIETRDGARLHTCQISPGLDIRAIRHP